MSESAGVDRGRPADSSGNAGQEFQTADAMGNTPGEKNLIFNTGINLQRLAIEQSRGSHFFQRALIGQHNGPGQAIVKAMFEPPPMTR